MQNKSELSLKRELSATHLALNAINLTVGAGIFVLPAAVALNLGAAGFIAYILCGALVVLIMLCFAELGSKITRSGGAYAYVETAFGPLAGFLINTLFWFGFAALADAAVINAMTDMLAKWYPALKLSNNRILFFIIVFGLLAWVNIRGVKKGSNFAIAATVLKLTPLLLMILVGFFSISPQHLTINSWPSINNLGETALMLFFAFMGTETALNVSGEIKNPQITIPKGILMGITGILIIYILIQFVAQGVLGNDLSQFQDAPLAAVASRLIGPVGGTIILITAVVSMFGLLSGDILATPRILYAASKDKLLPAFLSRIHPTYATPYWSIIVYSSVGFIFASSGSFKQLAIFASSSVLIIYLAVILSMIRLRTKKGYHETGSFKVPGGLIIPLLAIITICWFLSHITVMEIIGLLVFFVLLTMFYFIYKLIRRQTNPIT